MEDMGASVWMLGTTVGRCFDDMVADGVAMGSPRSRVHMV